MVIIITVMIATISYETTEGDDREKVVFNCSFAFFYDCFC